MARLATCQDDSRAHLDIHTVHVSPCRWQRYLHMQIVLIISPRADVVSCRCADIVIELSLAQDLCYDAGFSTLPRLAQEDHLNFSRITQKLAKYSVTLHDSLSTIQAARKSLFAVVVRAKIKRTIERREATEVQKSHLGEVLTGAPGMPLAVRCQASIRIVSALLARSCQKNVKMDSSSMCNTSPSASMRANTCASRKTLSNPCGHSRLPHLSIPAYVHERLAYKAYITRAVQVTAAWRRSARADGFI